MSNLDKYKGIIPAFYACYDEQGNVSPERVRALTQYYMDKGVKGVYVNGSSGECIYQGVAERKIIIENVMAVAKGKMTVINHVACNNTRDSVELAKHSEEVGVDAIASIPPIYFRLPEYSIAAYWNAISAAAPNTDFVIYNIPQLANTFGTTLAFIAASAVMVFIKYGPYAADVSIWSYSIISIAVSLVVGIPASMIWRAVKGDKSVPAPNTTIYKN